MTCNLFLSQGCPGTAFGLCILTQLHPCYYRTTIAADGSWCFDLQSSIPRYDSANKELTSAPAATDYSKRAFTPQKVPVLTCQWPGYQLVVKYSEYRL